MHALCSFNVINWTIAGSGDLVDVSGTRYTYLGHVVGWYLNNYYDVQVRVVVDRSESTARGWTPDGRIVGTITAYCVGASTCPAAVNTI